MGKEEWKETGKELGDAAQGLAKTIIRSAFTGLDKAKEWAESEDGASGGTEAESNVFNDGSWRKTGKDIGKAMKSVGQTITGTAKKADTEQQSKTDGED